MSDHADSKTFKLKKPIKTGDKPITEITLREPIAAELEMAENQARKLNDNGRINNIHMILQIISMVSSVNLVSIKQLGARDYTALAGYISDFLGDAPITGES